MKNIDRSQVHHGGYLITPEEAEYAFLRIPQNFEERVRWEAVPEAFAREKMQNPDTARRVARVA